MTTWSPRKRKAAASKRPPKGFVAVVRNVIGLKERLLRRERSIRGRMASRNF